MLCIKHRANDLDASDDILYVVLVLTRVSVLLCTCLRRCIIWLITGVLWSLLLLLLGLRLFMMHVSAQLVHPALEVCLPFLVDTHLELHLV